MNRTLRFGLLLALVTAPASAQRPRVQQWTGTWAASPSGPPAEGERTPRTSFKNETLRLFVHTSIGGTSVRIRLSNTFGTDALTVSAAHIALGNGGGPSGSDRALTFGGRSGIVIPAGATVLSDSTELRVPALGDVAVSLYLPTNTAGSTIHYDARQTSFVAPGDQTALPTLSGARDIASWPFLGAVEVTSAQPQAAIVALGSSTTDGARSTSGSNHRWTNTLAARLQHDARLRNIAVLNEGIGGNRVLHDGRGPSGASFGPSASARFDRDVLAQSGVRFLIVFEGGNDINHPGASAPLSETVSVDDMIAGYRQMIARAHAHGIRVIGGTITPFEGVNKPADTAAREPMRRAVNHWILSSHEFDGTIDFAKSIADPLNPARVDPRFDSGDHLHPNDAGYDAMGNSIDLKLFLH